MNPKIPVTKTTNQTKDDLTQPENKEKEAIENINSHKWVKVVEGER